MFRLSEVDHISIVANRITVADQDFLDIEAWVRTAHEINP